MDAVFLEGAISVKAALEADSREVYCLYIDKEKQDRNFAYIISLAKRKHISVLQKDRSEIDALAQGSSHGGMLAEVGPRRFAREETLFQQEKPFLALLEGVEDPFNFGEALRALYAAGATGIIVSARNWFTASATVAKASAGASELLPIVSSDNLEATVSQAKAHGIPFICAERKDATSLYETDLPRPLLLAVGGALRGLSSGIVRLADKRVYIPYGSPFRNALSTATSCAVFGFEIHRQSLETKR